MVSYFGPSLQLSSLAWLHLKAVESCQSLSAGAPASLCVAPPQSGELSRQSMIIIFSVVVAFFFFLS